MRQMVATAAVAMLLAGSPAEALDTSGVDILGMRLGMSEADIVNQLAHQGFAPTRQAGACSPSDTCEVTLNAVTKDGVLRVTVSRGTGAERFKYVFLGRGTGEPRKIEAAIIDRFGYPDQRQPMAWCRAVGTDGFCPPDQASLTFWPESLTIVLKAGSADGPR